MRSRNCTSMVCPPLMLQAGGDISVPWNVMSSSAASTAPQPAHSKRSRNFSLVIHHHGHRGVKLRRRQLHPALFYRHRFQLRLSVDIKRRPVIFTNCKQGVVGGVFYPHPVPAISVLRTVSPLITAVLPLSCIRKSSLTLLPQLRVYFASCW